MGLWCVVPAGGSGSRVGAAVPKQYLDLDGRPLLVWTLQALARLGADAILLVVAPGDDRAAGLAELPEDLEIVPHGGATRAESVLAGLDALADRAAPHDWVLVHDAARPCLNPELARGLLAQVEGHPDGGLLAEPVAETVKEAVRGAAGVEAVRTLDRDGLWLAQTPQVFRFERLRGALADALAAGAEITDEASAVERAGGRPLLVPGARANLKVTRPEDLALAGFWLRQARDAAAGRAEAAP